jgi:hypothetical protein
LETHRAKALRRRKEKVCPAGTFETLGRHCDSKPTPNKVNRNHRLWAFPQTETKDAIHDDNNDDQTHLVKDRQRTANGAIDSSVGQNGDPEEEIKWWKQEAG